jgi:enoyl-CoA hydratase/carnithine racemase
MDTSHSRRVANPFQIEAVDQYHQLRLTSDDGTNRLTSAAVLALTDALRNLQANPKPLIIAGNERFFSAGADLSEIQSLSGPAACEFAKHGQRLMRAIEQFPAPVYAAIEGYCMGGGLDLALGCRWRIAGPAAVFGHRGAALGLMTGWGGTQRLPRIVGAARALELFASAEKIDAAQALEIGLVHALVDDPVAEAVRRIEQAREVSAAREIQT